MGQASADWLDEAVALAVLEARPHETFASFEPQQMLRGEVLFSATEQGWDSLSLEATIKMQAVISLGLRYGDEVNVCPIVRFALPNYSLAYEIGTDWVQDLSVSKALPSNSGLLLAALPPQTNDELGRVVIYFVSDQRVLTDPIS